MSSLLSRQQWECYKQHEPTFAQFLKELVEAFGKPARFEDKRVSDE